ncbi:MAG: polymerase sigma-70 factor, subfamily [Mycobacteriales bacterium]|jgi:RNA polymerase sigma-70 factor (ECF subfamily)
MSSYAEPDPTAIGLRALLAAVITYRTAAGPGRPRLDSRAGARNSVGPGGPDAGGAGAIRAGAAAAGSPPPGEPDPGADPGGEVWTLVRAAQAGDPEAFGRIYDRYLDLVFRYAYHRLGDRTLAEDITSETFVRALRRLDSLQYQGRDIGAWLVTITRNLILDHLKSSRYRMEVVTDDLRQADRATEGPEAAVLDRLANATLLRCVRQLGAEQQECVVLRFLQGLSVAETAVIMGKNEGAIKALQHRAIRRLASLLPEDPR